MAVASGSSLLTAVGAAPGLVDGMGVGLWSEGVVGGSIGVADSSMGVVCSADPFVDTEGPITNMLTVFSVYYCLRNA